MGPFISNGAIDEHVDSWILGKSLDRSSNFLGSEVGNIGIKKENIIVEGVSKAGFDSSGFPEIVRMIKQKDVGELLKNLRGIVGTTIVNHNELGEKRHLRKLGEHVGEAERFVVGGDNTSGGHRSLLRTASQITVYLDALLRCFALDVRRRWDSNPRVLAHKRFPSVRNGPLSDSSRWCLLYQGSGIIYLWRIFC